jgi:hypothetical protein
MALVWRCYGVECVSSGYHPGFISHLAKRKRRPIRFRLALIFMRTPLSSPAGKARPDGPAPYFANPFPPFAKCFALMGPLQAFFASAKPGQMKFSILPIIVILTVIVIVTITKHYSHTKKAAIKIELTQPDSLKDGPLVNDVIFEFLRRELFKVSDDAQDEVVKYS